MVHSDPGSNRVESAPGKSVIVAAHPDDEVVWFSSVIEKVDDIIICYRDVDSKPKWTKGRRDSLAAYPLPNVSCLGIKESEVFDCANWADPVVMDYGLEVSNKTGSIARYKENYATLYTILEERLKGYDTVYTHNPWGEYGHEEHAQVYRVIRSLQERLPFRLWYTNYFSNKSIHYMQRILADSPLVNRPLPTNPIFATKVMELYRRHNCWTWYDNYIWPDQECFILDETPKGGERIGKTLGLNFVQIGPSPIRRSKAVARLKHVLRRTKKRLRWIAS